MNKEQPIKGKGLTLTSGSAIVPNQLQYLKEKLNVQSGEERLLAEIAELKAWKESMISVTPDMQEIGKALGVKLGDSIHDKILPGIERLKNSPTARYREADLISFAEYVGHSWIQSGLENNIWYDKFDADNPNAKESTTEKILKTFIEQNNFINYSNNQQPNH